MGFKNMTSDEQKDWIETFIGGVCGGIAIVAAIIEYLLGDNGEIAGMFKDIFGTAVVVVLLFAAMPKRKPKNLANILKQAMEEWGENNAPLIFKAEEYVATSNYSQGFRLLQDPKKDYIGLAMQKLSKDSAEWKRYAKYSKGNHLTGKFLDMPSYEEMVLNDFKLSVCLEQSHFKKIPAIDKIIDDIQKSINAYENKMSAHRVGLSQTIVLSYPQINSIEDVKDFVDAIDFVLSIVKVVA